MKLGKLICLYDDNRISLAGTTSISFSEDRAKRFEAYGWQVLTVEDGNDVSAIEAALLAAVTNAGIPAHRADARKVKAFIRSFVTGTRISAKPA